MIALALRISGVVFGFIILLAASRSEAPTSLGKNLPSSSTNSDNIRHTQRSFKNIFVPHRRPLICRKRFLDPRIVCGCVAFYKFYVRNPEWKVLRKACLKKLHIRPARVFARRRHLSLRRIRKFQKKFGCRRKGFSKRSGKFRFKRIGRFFRTAKKICVAPKHVPETIEPPVPETPTPTEETPVPVTEEPDFPPRKEHPISSSRELSGPLTIGDFRQGTSLTRFVLDSTKSLVIRSSQPTDRMIRTFCIVALDRLSGKSSEETYCDCSPRDPECQ